MAGNKRTSAEWVELIARQRASGQALKTWCAENGINVYTMADRISRLRKAGCIDKPLQPTIGTAWLEVGESPAMPVAVQEIQVRVNGFAVVVPKDFYEESFIRICKVLMSIC